MAAQTKESVGGYRKGFAWGAGSAGGLGTGATADAWRPVPVELPAGTVEVTGGRCFSLARTASGELWAWGSGRWGQLGDGSTRDRVGAPVKVALPGAGEVATVAAGDEHVLALSRDGQVWAWGRNWAGQLGDGTTTDRTTPTPVMNVGPVMSVAAGTDFSLAVTVSGEVLAWGSNSKGQLGVTSLGGSRATPVTSSLPASSHAAAAAGSSSALVLTNSGVVVEMGIAANTPLAAAGATGSQSEPKQVSIPSPVVGLATGVGHNVALTSVGHVYTWGSNSRGQLGDEGRQSRTVPRRVDGPTKIKHIAAGAFHTVAIEETGELWTWGDNTFGQAGGGYRNDVASKRVVANIDGDIVHLGAGSYHNVIVTGPTSPVVLRHVRP
jgi:alpha-tubulin suppressor-like RCC1 family protein